MLECSASLPPRKHDGVAALDAQTRRIDGDIGPGFVNEEDDAQRHADLLNLQTVGPNAAVKHAANRIGQGRHLPQTVGGGANTLDCQTQPFPLSF